MREDPLSPRLSVVIPTYNRARCLRRTLNALERQTLPAAEFEVVAIDDGSTDETPAVLAEMRQYALRALSQRNAGPGAARNAGVLEARAATIVFVDDDVVPTPQLLALHAAAQDETPGVVIGSMLPPPRARQPVWAAWEAQMLRKQYDDMTAGRWAPTPRQFYTANASVPRESLLAAGLFDPTFARAEDVELAYRLLDIGLPFRFVAEASVEHDTPRTLAGYLAIPEKYGRYDAIMWRDRGRAHIMNNVAVEYEFGRNSLLRAVARVTVGRRRTTAAVRLIAKPAIAAADRLRLDRPGQILCSATFNLLYWHGVAAEVGGRGLFWQRMALELHRHQAATEAARA